MEDAPLKGRILISIVEVEEAVVNVLNNGASTNGVDFACKGCHRLVRHLAAVVLVETYKFPPAADDQSHSAALAATQ